MWREHGAPCPLTGDPHCPSGGFSFHVEVYCLHRDLLPGIDVHMPLPGHLNFFLFAAFLKKSA